MNNCRVDVSKATMGVVYMQVCACKDATDSEIIEVCNRENPTTVLGGWEKVFRVDTEFADLRPKQCQVDSERLHLLVRSKHFA